MPYITLTIESRPENVALLSAAVRGLCSDAAVSEITGMQIELALAEACNNVIEHAYDNEPGHLMTAVWKQDGDRLCIDLIDQGQTMTALPAAEMPDVFEEHGRGWPIIRACMDEIHYRSAGADNILTLIKLIGDHPHPAPADGRGK